MLKDMSGTYAAGLTSFAFFTGSICIVLLEYGASWQECPRLLELALPSSAKRTVQLDQAQCLVLLRSYEV